MPTPRFGPLMSFPLMIIGVTRPNVSGFTKMPVEPLAKAKTAPPLATIVLFVTCTPADDPPDGLWITIPADRGLPFEKPTSIVFRVKTVLGASACNPPLRRVPPAPTWPSNTNVNPRTVTPLA